MSGGANFLSHWKIPHCHIKNLFSSVSGLLQFGHNITLKQSQSSSSQPLLVLKSAASLSDLKPCVPQSFFAFISAKQVDLLRLNIFLHNCCHSNLEVCQKCP